MAEEKKKEVLNINQDAKMGLSIGKAAQLTNLENEILKLKGMAYDLLAEIQLRQNQLGQINQMIAQKFQEIEKLKK